MVVSTRNNGAISDLPDDVVVEVSSIITSGGPVPISWGSFEPSSRGLLQLMKDMELTTIKAAVTGDYGTAQQAFTINPLVPSGKIAKTVLDELLIAHKEHLPQFKETIKVSCKDSFWWLRKSYSLKIPPFYVKIRVKSETVNWNIRID